ncbi:MAG TPA: serine/threonine-protein kinase [Polyangiaceae bacterium]|jgi:serine/threonine protein kinase
MSEAAAPDAPSTADRRGAWVGRYVLLDTIAEGGMGVVYAAFDSQLDRKVAIKILRPTLSKGEDAAEAEARLLREAQAMARLSHPNVVTIHDVGVMEGNVFLAMEYVEGGTLKERLRSGRSWREGLALLKEAGRGLAAAHAAGLVHRDFKPDNVLVGTDGRVRVTDFGIARAEEGAPADAHTETKRRADASLSRLGAATPIRQLTSSRDSLSIARSGNTVTLAPASSTRSLSDPLTGTGDLLGTVGYMAPEQAFGEHVDARSDQFSFCATLYLALYGEKPFRDSDVDVYLMALTGPVRDAPSGSKVPPWLRRIVLKGLSLQPSQRYASMDELLAALEHDPAVARRRWLAMASVPAAIALAAFAYQRAEATRTLHCASAEADLSGVWDGTAKDDMRRAFEATGAVMEADSFQRATKALDAYADSWRAARTEVCEATKVRHEQSEEVYSLRADCLDRQKNEMRALVSIFRRADRGAVDQAVKAAYGLTSVNWCQDVNALRASSGLPVEPVKRARVLEARAALATSASLGLAGKNSEAVAEAQRARDMAREAGHGATEAEALFEAGYNRQRLGEYETAGADLTEAMTTAYAAADDAVFVRAAARMAFIVGDKLYRPVDAQRLLGLARAGLERVGGSEVLEADILSTDALLQIAQGYPALAAPKLERVVRVYRSTIGTNPITAITLNNLGYSLHLAGRNSDALSALEQSRAMLEALFGAEKHTTGIPLCNTGAANLGLGRVAEAERYLHHALDVFEREQPGGFWSGWALQYLALASTLDGDPEAATNFGRHGLAIADKLGASQRLVPGLTVATADALVATGKADEALGLCARALEVQERVGLIAADKVYDWDALRCRGEALLALKRTAEAVPPLERSVLLQRRVFPWDLPRARFALARALVVTDHLRAVTLAEQARDGFQSLPEAKRMLLDVEAWLRAHG